MVETLSSHVDVKPQFLRSANLERDREAESGDYIPVGRALEMVRRFISTFEDAESTRAWSITGPYGSGKSSLALFLDALVGPSVQRRHQRALEALDRQDPSSAKALRAARRRGSLPVNGFLRAVVTARQESPEQAIARALRSASERYWHGKAIPLQVSRALRRISPSVARDSRSVAAEILGALQVLTEYAPVFIVLDEFGKNLEWAAKADRSTDLYLLQQIAELASGSRGLPLYFLTLQHLAFHEYAASLPEVAREWSKIQGRFEDFGFASSSEQLTRLIAGALHRKKESGEFAKRIGKWARVCADSLRSKYDVGFLSAPDLIAQSYPLHPMTVVALAELAARFGQQERTLFTFLRGDEPGSLRTFLRETPYSPSKLLPVLTIDRLYDYFVGSVTTPVFTAESTRWFEIETRVREASQVAGEELKCLKAIAVLNLTDSVFKASPEALAQALSNLGDGTERPQVERRISELEKRGLVTYRKFAGELRIWQGTDVDVETVLARCRDELAEKSSTNVLSETIGLSASVASRHSQTVGTLRFFERRIFDPSQELTVPSDADGLVAYCLERKVDLAAARLPGIKPIILAFSPDADRLDRLAREAAATAAALQRSEVASDWVAKNELQERLMLAKFQLSREFDETYSPIRDGVTWIMATTGQELPGSGGLSPLLSLVCDEAYGSTPVIKSEMLARRELTTQGARARRILLEAMINHASEPKLGLAGYGPERAMYEAVLGSTGWHRQMEDGSYGYERPSRKSSFYRAWKRLQELFQEGSRQRLCVSRVFEVLSAPPFGLKGGPIPVIVTAALLERNEDVAIFQDGTYQSTLTIDLIERMMATPERFELQTIAATGLRQAAVEALSEAFGSKNVPRASRRNSSLVSVVRPMVAAIKALPAYTISTSRLSERATAARNAILNARDPEQLLFVDLPVSCGVEPLRSRSKDVRRVGLELAERVTGALHELSAAYPALIEEISGLFSEALGTPSHLNLRTDISARAQRLLSEVLDKRLKSFLLAASDSQLEDADWIEALAMNLAGQPPAFWRDEDVQRFRTALADVAASFYRLEALHFETRLHPREGFKAKRITVTSPTGAEVSRVVWLDSSMAKNVGRIVDTAMRAAEAALGSQGREALLASLADALLEPPDREDVATEVIHADRPRLREVQGWKKRV